MIGVGVSRLLMRGIRGRRATVWVWVMTRIGVVVVVGEGVGWGGWVGVCWFGRVSVVGYLFLLLRVCCSRRAGVINSERVVVGGRETE